MFGSACVSIWEASVESTFVNDLERIRELLDNLKVSCEETNQDAVVTALEEADQILNGIDFAEADADENVDAEGDAS
jgi:hypothetical protein